MDLHSSHDAGPAAQLSPPLQSFDRFFDLPQELQEHVLGFLVPQNTRILIGPLLSASLPPSRGGGVGARGRDSNGEGGSTSWLTTTSSYLGSDDAAAALVSRDRRARQGRPRRIRDVPPPTALRLAHPLLGALADRMYWAHNEFHLNFLPAAAAAAATAAGSSSTDGIQGSRAEAETAPRAFLSPGGPAAAAPAAAAGLARRLVVYVRRLDERLWAGAVCAALERLVLRGGLRGVEVRVVAGGAGGEPLARLVRVLADPDLEGGGAALRVWRRGHKAFWCRFHARRHAGGCGRQKCGSAATGSGAVVVDDGGVDDDDGDDEWLSIDVPALIREYGGDTREGKIVRVGGRFTGY